MNREAQGTIYIVQNETHLANFELLANEEKDFFLLVDKLAGSSISDTAITRIKGKFLYYRYDGDGRFYLDSKLKRLIRIARLRLPASLDPIDYRLMRIGNDSAISRKLIYLIQKSQKERHRKITVELWADGLLEPAVFSFIRFLYKTFNRVLTRLGLDFYFPSNVGLSSRLDSIKVMTNSCKRSMVLNGVEAEKINVEVFPRHSAMLKNYETFSMPKSSRERILLVVSAFAFHGHPDIEEWENELVILFAREAKNFSELSCFIRPHPMSSERLKASIRSTGMQSTEIDIYSEIYKSTTIVSFASTVLLEAVLLKKKALVYEKGFESFDRGAFIKDLPRAN